MNVIQHEILINIEEEEEEMSNEMTNNQIE